MDAITELLSRGVEQIYPSREALEKVLRSGKKLKLYQGFDPTGNQLHIGHMVGLRKLAQFQRLGHRVVFVIGDGTGQAGDPSGKTKGRQFHSYTLSTHENVPGTLNRMLEPFAKEGISLEAIKSEKTGEDISFRIVIDEEKYNPLVISQIIRSLGSQGFFTNEQLRINAKSYVEQASKIINFTGPNPVKILFNGDWLNKLSLEDILSIAGRFSLQQLIERDLFQERLKRNEEINLREFLYPLLQAYDSVVLNVDLEVGGSDQTFNMLCGRTLTKNILGKDKFVLTTPLLTDSRGVKIGKTEGNVIALTDNPNEFYAKILSLGDDAIIPCFTLLTDTPTETIVDIEKRMKSGGNPMVYKKLLAFELTKQLNGEDQANVAQKEFETRFQKGDLKESDLPTVSLTSFAAYATAIDHLTALKLAQSNSDARRLVEQKAVSLNGTLIELPKKEFQFKPGDIFKAGRKAVKIVK